MNKNSKPTTEQEWIEQLPIFLWGKTISRDAYKDAKMLAPFIRDLFQSAYSQGEQKGKVDTAREIFEMNEAGIKGSPETKIKWLSNWIKAKYLTTEKEKTSSTAQCGCVKSCATINRKLVCCCKHGKTEETVGVRLFVTEREEK